MDGTIVDDPDRQRFTVEHDGETARLEYDLDGERLVLTHTQVPEALGGRGIGGTLVRAAVERAARDGLVVVPRCPYARSWLEKHPDVAGTVTIEVPPDAEAG